MKLLLMGFAAMLAQDLTNGPVPKEIQQMPNRFSSPAPGCGYTGKPECYYMPQTKSIGATPNVLDVTIVPVGFPAPEGTVDPPPVVTPPVDPPPVVVPPIDPPPATGYTIPLVQWLTVGKEGDTVAGLKGMTFRYGSPVSTYAIDVDNHRAGEASPEAWTLPITLTSDAAVAISSASFSGVDPIYGVYKVMQVQFLSVPMVTTVFTPLPKTYTCNFSTSNTEAPALACAENKFVLVVK